MAKCVCSSTFNENNNSSEFPNLVHNSSEISKDDSTSEPSYHRKWNLLTPLDHYATESFVVSKIENLVQMGSSRTKQVGNNNWYVKQQCSYVLDHFIQHENRLRLYA